jgi:hypothetical protein
MKDFKQNTKMKAEGCHYRNGGKVQKMQAGGLTSAVPIQEQLGLGAAAPSGAMGVAAPGEKYTPGKGPNLRVGY